MSSAQLEQGTTSEDSNVSRSHRLATALVLGATLAALAQMTVDVIARLAAFSLPWAFTGFDLAGLLVALLALALLSLRGHGPSPIRRSLAVGLVAAATGWAIRWGQSSDNPVTMISAPFTFLGIGASLLCGSLVLRQRPEPAPLVYRTGQVVACASFAMAGLLTAAHPPQTLLDDFRDTEITSFLVVAGLAMIVSAFAAVALDDRRRVLLCAPFVLWCAWAIAAAPTAQVDRSWRILLGVLLLGAAIAPVAFFRAAVSGCVRWWHAGASNAAAARRHLAASARASRRLLSPEREATPLLEGHRLGRRDLPWVAGLAAITIGVMVCRLVWAYRAGAQPIGHGASVISRAWDVGTANTPMIGMPTSYADPDRGVAVYHPGPMFFNVLAPFVRLLGFRSGAMIGSTVLNLAWWLVAVWAAFKANGRAAALGAWVATGAVLFVLLKGVVWEPATVFPTLAAILACILLCWAASCGTWFAWPWAVGLFSVMTHAYLAHAIVAFVPVVWAGLALFAAGRRWPDEAARSRRALLIGLGVLVTTWIQPLIEAVFNDGGNVRALWYAITSDRPSVGSPGLWKAPAWMFEVPPQWGRFDRFFAPDYRHYVSGASAIGLTVLACLVAVWFVTRTEASLAERRLRALTVLVILSASASLALMPMAFTAFYQVAWLGVLSAFGWFVGGLTLVRALQRRVELPAPGVQRVAGAVAGLAVVGLLLNSPFDLRELKGAYGAIDPAVPVIFDSVTTELPNGEVLVLGMDRSTEQTIADALTAELIISGRDVRVEPYIGSYFGPRRSVGPDWSGQVLQVFDASGSQPPDGRIVASYVPEGWSPVAFAATAEAVKRWAVEHGPIEIDQIVAPFLAPYVDGTDLDMNCAFLERLEAGDVSLEKLPAEAFAKLYADAAIRRPQLPESLRRAVDSDVGATPTEVWLREWDGANGPIESARLLRNGELCQR